MSAEDTRPRVLGVAVDGVTLAEAVEIVAGWARSEGGRLRQVVTINPEFIIAARRDPAFADVLRRADLATADGVGVTVAARLLGRPLPERVTGVELIEGLAARRPSPPLFLLGAGPGVAERAAARLRARHPAVEIAGCWSGSPRPEDAPEALRRIRASGARVLLVAYGAPAQERWISRHRDDLAACGIVVAIGVGGAFDYLAGAVPRAPRVVRRLGLEWLYRLIREPWRWRRQLALPLFALLILRDRLRRRRAG